jgi:Pyruvate/2-oxoacid:ferredoxin oxidoreductase delta subunit
MEGNGPRGGNPVNMKVLLFSTDPVALDAVMCRLINLNPELVATITCGKEYGLGNYAENEIELLGDSIKDLINCKFDVVRKPLEHVTTGEIISFFKNSISSRPVIDKEKCTKCGTCVKVCPVNPKVVDWHNGNKNVPPVYNYKRCIRCYCCQELCPEKAISIKSTFMGRLLLRR